MLDMNIVAAQAVLEFYLDVDSSAIFARLAALST